MTMIEVQLALLFFLLALWVWGTRGMLHRRVKLEDERSVVTVVEITGKDPYCCLTDIER